MSMKAVIVSLVVVIAAAVGAFFLLRPAASAPVRESVPWLTSLDASGVRAIAVGEAGGGLRVESPSGEGGHGGVWRVVRPDGLAWPAQESRVRGAVRLLADLGNAQVGEAPGAGVREVRLELAGTGMISAKIDSAPLAGRTRVEVTGPQGERALRIGEAGLADVFSATGVAAWMDPALVRPGVGALDRVQLESGARMVVLERGRGRWIVAQPGRVPADDAATRRLEGVLAGLTAARLMPDEPIANAGIERPTGFVRVESVVRSAVQGGEVAERRLVQELRMGSAADAAQKSVFVVVQAFWMDRATGRQTPAWGPMVAVIDRARLDTIVADPAAYFARSAVGVPVADVGGLAIWSDAQALQDDAGVPKEVPASAHRLARTIDGWRVRVAGIPDRVLEPAGLEAVAAFVKALCETPAAEVRITPPENIEGYGWVRVDGAAGAPLELVGIGVAEVMGKAALVLRTGNVWRVYPGGVAQAVWARERMALD